MSDTPNADLEEQVEQLYDHLCNNEHGNAWEQDFLTDIYKRFIEQSMSLTEKQVEKIEELHAKHFPDGCEPELEDDDFGTDPDDDPD